MMQRCRRRTTLSSLTLMTAVLALSDARAQPEPSLRADCGRLRGALRQLDGKAGELITIEVEGALTMVRSDGALVYLVLCQAPAPHVLCITYAENGARVGDRVVVSGGYERVGPNHVKLDPCLHHAPGGSEAG